MLPIFFKKQGQQTPLVVLLLLALVVLSMLFAACSGGGTTTPPTASNPSAPSDLLTAGVLTVGSDTTYPPQEYLDPTTHRATGFDVDLITAIAKQLGLQTKIVPTTFASIMSDLVAKHFDVVISALSVTAQRQQQVDFVPYLNAGESLLVQKGNPKAITSTDDLCGLAVGVQDGTIEQGVLQSSSDNCKEQEKPAITIIALPDQMAVIHLLATKRVVATYQDSPVSDYYSKQNSSQFEVGGSVFGSGPEGIAIRKNDPSMFNAIQTAYHQVKTAGTYHQLILKWGLPNAELSTIDRRLNDA